MGFFSNKTPVLGLAKGKLLAGTPDNGQSLVLQKSEEQATDANNGLNRLGSSDGFVSKLYLGDIVPTEEAARPNLKHGLLAFPIPSSGIVSVAFPCEELENESATWRVEDLVGKLMVSGTSQAANQFTVDISSLPTGVYSLSVFTKCGRFSSKILKF